MEIDDLRELDLIVAYEGQDLNELPGESSRMVFYFDATWCGPCRVMRPIIAEVAERFADADITFVHVDVDEDHELTPNMGVRSIPHLLVCRDGGVTDRKVGTGSLDEIVGWIRDKCLV